MPLPERVDYKESVVTLPQNVTVSQNIPASTSQLLKSTLEEKLSFPRVTLPTIMPLSG